MTKPKATSKQAADPSAKAPQDDKAARVGAPRVARKSPRKLAKKVPLTRAQEMRAAFEQYYVQGGPGFKPGNAHRSALAAGYSKETAKGRSSEMAAQMKITMSAALNAVGLDKITLALKVKDLMKAKTVRWNKVEEEWEPFEDNGTQTDATRIALQIQGAFPSGRVPNKDGSFSDSGAAPVQVHIHTSIKRPPAGART